MPVNAVQLRTLLGAWLKDTVQVWEPGEPVSDETTGQTIPGPPIIHYDGPGLIYPQSAAERDVEVAGSTYTVTRYDVMLPAGTDTTVTLQANLDAGTKMKITPTTCALNPELVGVDFVIVDVPLDPYSLATTAVAERVT